MVESASEFRVQVKLIGGAFTTVFNFSSDIDLSNTDSESVNRDYRKWSEYIFIIL
jgi:hypothetical protein